MFNRTGLYLSRQIIEAHGGKIWVESKLNKEANSAFFKACNNGK
jgi:signal transduction histidine kinase